MRDGTVTILRGFDAYEVRLGDMLRGERASHGKSLLDVQRELKIKAAYVDAIENCDASVFPNRGYVAGYVRAYARYLGLDANEVFRRFCDESGFEGVNSELAGLRAGARPGPAAAPRRGPGDEFLQRSRFRRPSGPAISPATLSGLGSVLVLAVLVSALGYGAWYLLQDIQRLGFAPVSEAPEIALDPAAPPAPVAELAGTLPRPAAARTLEDLYAPRLPVPRVDPRDGPIAAIDPERHGIYARPPAEAAAPAPAIAAAGPAEPAPAVAAEAPLAVPPAPAGVEVVATDSAWIRVFLEDGTVIFEKILRAGETYPVPADLAGPLLRAGNAGAVYLRVGATAYGPLGRGTSVVRRVPLDANEIAASWPRAETAAAPGVPPTRAAGLPPGN